MRKNEYLKYPIKKDNHGIYHVMIKKEDLDKVNQKDIEKIIEYMVGIRKFAFIGFYPFDKEYSLMFIKITYNKRD